MPTTTPEAALPAPRRGGARACRSVLHRHAATLLGPAGAPPVVFAHGFGTDQTMWSRIVPAFAADRRVVLFDHVGAGRSDLAAHRPERHGSLHGYAADVVELVEALDLGPVQFVGHSASAMVGVLAAVARPDLFRALVLLGGSPRYVDADGYVGGFRREDVDGLLEALDSNYAACARSLAGTAMGNADRPELADELAETFARAESRIAVQFARAIFLSDVRDVLPRVTTPTLVVQPAQDPMVPEAVGRYLAGHVPGARYAPLAATGHFPHVSGPDETAAVLRAFLDPLA